MTDPTTPPGPNPDPPTVEALQREIAHLREQLARKTTEAQIYREAVYDMVRDKVSYPPMTEDEARELMNTPPGGETLGDIIAELEREIRG